MTTLSTSEASVLTAMWASAAAAELLRIAREREHQLTVTFSEAEPVRDLAGALKLAIEVEIDERIGMTDDEQAQLRQLLAPVAEFCRAWAR
ncbi:MAG: hypothetical protein K2Y20_13930 [Sphingomonas sp.]|nr:hypothetical protein [Sphingomonas sp.]